MKTFLRTILYLALVIWLGAEIFFPVVAAVTFTALMPDVHAAGTIVGALLRILHETGLAAGIVAMAVLAIAPAVRMYRPRAVSAPMLLLLVMILLTAYSQYGIIPAMDRDRVAAGGAIELGDTSSPYVADFNRLHQRSEHVEGAIILLGLATVALVAWAESTDPGSQNQKSAPGPVSS
jgi:Domain of unknown function (DUF4149)